MTIAARVTQKVTGWDARVRSMAGEIKEATECVVSYARKNANLRSMERQISKAIRRNPVQTMLAVTAIGFVGGMLIRRR